MDQLKATEESGYNFFTGEPSGSGGNPLLDPWEAWAFDVSYERYFGEGEGYVSVAAFYKDLDTYIYDQTLLFDFTGLPPQGPEPLLFTGTSTSPQNGQGGSIEGWELGGQIAGEMFMVAEGAKSAPAVMALAEEYGIDMPISRDVYRVVTGETNARGAYRGLLQELATAKFRESVDVSINLGVDPRKSEIRVVVLLLRTPAHVEVVLGAGTVQTGRPRFAVDEELGCKLQPLLDCAAVKPLSALTLCDATDVLEPPPAESIAYPS